MPEPEAKLWRIQLVLRRQGRANRQTSAKSCGQGSEFYVASCSKPWLCAWIAGDRTVTMAV